MILHPLPITRKRISRAGLHLPNMRKSPNEGNRAYNTSHSIIISIGIQRIELPIFPVSDDELSVDECSAVRSIPMEYTLFVGPTSLVPCCHRVCDGIIKHPSLIPGWKREDVED